MDAGALLPGDSGFGLQPGAGTAAAVLEVRQMAAVHAVASPDASRSHFQAQECFERGTATTAMHTGWLDRTLGALGPGTTFRAIAEGDATPRSLDRHRAEAGARRHRAFLPGRLDGIRDKTHGRRWPLYTGFEHPAATQAMTTFKALDAARKIAETPYQPIAPYPGGGFADRLKDVAR